MTSKKNVPLIKLRPKFFHSVDLGRPNQSIKREHNLRMTIICFRSFLQVGFRFQYQLINLVWLSIDYCSCPQSNFEKLKIYFSPSSKIEEKTHWGQG